MAGKPQGGNTEVSKFPDYAACEGSEQATRPGFKELLLGEGPRFAILVPKRGRLRA